MPVLLLRLAGPMQSWGISSRFGIRETEREPSKSGVLGLLCAALGAPREDDATLARLAAMPMGVRVNREGTVASDFQTVGAGRVAGEAYGVARADGGHGAVVLSRRDYLADADFLVGLEDEDCAWLERLDRALRAPVWPLCLGRRSYVPAVAPAVGVVEGGLQEVLWHAPFPQTPPEATSTPSRGVSAVACEQALPTGAPRLSRGPCQASGLTPRDSHGGGASQPTGAPRLSRGPRQASGLTPRDSHEGGALPPCEGPRLILEAPPGQGTPRHDVPVSFRHDQRRFRLRYVTVSYLPAELTRRTL